MKDVMDRLGRSVTDVADYIAALPAQELQFSTTPEWGAREVLIHLVFWQGQYVAITRALLEHSQPHLVTGTFKQANARAVETNRQESISSLLSRFAAAQADLSQLYPAARDLTIAFKAAGRSSLTMRR